jgi:hypothetical protein
MSRRVLSILLLTAVALPLAGCSGEPEPTQISEVAEQAPPPPSGEMTPPPPARETPQARRPAPQIPEERSAAPAQPASVTLTIPEGTMISLAMGDSLTSATAQVGDGVSATLTGPVVVGSRVAFPQGSRLEGRVTGVKPATKGFKDTGGGISVAFDRIVTPDGRSADISAGFTKLAEGSGKKKGAIIGGSAAGGALLGKVLGKDARGAAIIGGAIGTAVAGSTKGKEAEIDVAEEITIALEQGVRIKVKR